MDDRVKVNFVPGDLVFAKMKSYPPWPAKILDETVPTSSQHQKSAVQFFGTNEIGYVKRQDLFDYAEFRRKFGVERKAKGFNESLHIIAELYDELQANLQTTSPKTTRKRNLTPETCFDGQLSSAKLIKIEPESPIRANKLLPKSGKIRGQYSLKIKLEKLVIPPPSPEYSPAANFSAEEQLEERPKTSLDVAPKTATPTVGFSQQSSIEQPTTEKRVRKKKMFPDEFLVPQYAESAKRKAVQKVVVVPKKNEASESAKNKIPSPSCLIPQSMENDQSEQDREKVQLTPPATAEVSRPKSADQLEDQDDEPLSMMPPSTSPGIKIKLPSMFGGSKSNKLSSKRHLKHKKKLDVAKKRLILSKVTQFNEIATTTNKKRGRPRKTVKVGRMKLPTYLALRALKGIRKPEENSNQQKLKSDTESEDDREETLDQHVEEKESVKGSCETQPRIKVQRRPTLKVEESETQKSTTFCDEEATSSIFEKMIYCKQRSLSPEVTRPAVEEAAKQSDDDGGDSFADVVAMSKKPTATTFSEQCCEGSDYFIREKTRAMGQRSRDGFSMDNGVYKYLKQCWRVLPSDEKRRYQQMALEEQEKAENCSFSTITTEPIVREAEEPHVEITRPPSPSPCRVEELKKVAKESSLKHIKKHVDAPPKRKSTVEIRKRERLVKEEKNKKKDSSSETPATKVKPVLKPPILKSSQSLVSSLPDNFQLILQPHPTQQYRHLADKAGSAGQAAEVGPAEARYRWWLYNSLSTTTQQKRASRENSPPRSLTNDDTSDATAMFRILAKTFQQMGHKLQQSASGGINAKAQHSQQAAIVDCLMDAFVVSMVQILGILRHTPVLNECYPKDVVDGLLEKAIILTPL